MKEDTRHIYHFHLDKNGDWCKDKLKIKNGDIDDECCLIHTYGDKKVEYLRQECRTSIWEIEITHNKAYYRFRKDKIDSWYWFKLHNEYYSLENIELKTFKEMVLFDDYARDLKSLDGELLETSMEINELLRKGIKLLRNKEILETYMKKM